MRGHRDLRWTAIAAVVCALVAALVPWEIVRIFAALPLTLFLPGYALVAVSFGAGELALPKRLVLSVGVSLIVLVLGTLLLNVFPFGIRTASWAILLAVVVLAACRGAALRRDRPRPRRQRQPLLAGVRLSGGSVALLAAAVLIAGAALVLAQKPVSAKDAEGFTALWMLPTDAREDAVRVGVLSSEQDPASYRLEVKVKGSPPRMYRVNLDPGEEESFEVEVPRTAGGRAHVVASLYRAGKPQRLFRRVTRWLPRQPTFPRAP
jgi:uncharacterized membrane protein